MDTYVRPYTKAQQKWWKYKLYQSFMENGTLSKKQLQLMKNLDIEDIYPDYEREMELKAIWGADLSPILRELEVEKVSRKEYDEYMRKQRNKRGGKAKETEADLDRKIEERVNALFEAKMNK